MENNRTNFWIWNNYFWKVPILHIIQNHWKNQLYYELLSFNLTEIYPIVQLSSLTHPVDSQCIQVNSLKSISFPDIRGDFHIYTARESATLTKKCQNDVLCGNMNMYVSPHILKLKFYKNTCSAMTAWIHAGLL